MYLRFGSLRFGRGARFSAVATALVFPLVTGAANVDLDARPVADHTGPAAQSHARTAALQRQLAPSFLDSAAAALADAEAAPPGAGADGTGAGSPVGSLTAARPVMLPEPWKVARQVILVAKADRHRKIRVSSPKGSRLWTASALVSHDLPQAALTAYKNAAATVNRLDPSCQMPWTLLAGIGRVESDHGRYGGSVLGADGVSRPAIIGIALDGQGPVAAIRDTDNGKLDKDKIWDRAVGPMQFIPSTWANAKRDGDGDGTFDPHDIDDAALAAATYLCSGSGSLLVDASQKAAIFRYNPSDYYVALVQAFERGYRTGIFIIPSPPAPEDETTAHHKRHKKKSSASTRTVKSSTKKSGTKTGTKTGAKKTSTKKSDGQSSGGSSSPKPSPKPSPTPSPKPSPKPSPTTPDPSPSTPTLSTLSGAVSACNGGWCVGSTKLDLGPAGQLAAKAAHDYDGDGTVETNTDELTGLVGSQVTLQVGAGTSPAVVYTIGGADYRFADGSFA